MSAEIHQFPVSRRLENKRIGREQDKRNVLAEWLRELATLLQRDDLQTEPSAITLIFSGKTGDEVVWKGYQDNPDVSLGDVARAVGQQFYSPYKRRGGSFHDRRTP